MAQPEYGTEYAPVEATLLYTIYHHQHKSMEFLLI